MKYFRNIVCLSGISSDGSICCEAREYQCVGPALFTENFIEGNPITLSSIQRSAECLPLMANMTTIDFVIDKKLILIWLDMRVYCSCCIKRKSNFFYEDISAWGKHAWYRCLRQQKTKSRVYKTANIFSLNNSSLETALPLNVDICYLTLTTHISMTVLKPHIVIEFRHIFSYILSCYDNIVIYPVLTRLWDFEIILFEPDWMEIEPDIEFSNFPR